MKGSIIKDMIIVSLELIFWDSPHPLRADVLIYNL